MAQHRWPEPIRLAALRLRAEQGSSAEVIAAQISEEHGVRLVKGTVAAWLRDEARRLPPDRPAAVASLADRAVALLSREMEGLERQPRSKTDLSRLDQIARTLKTLDGLRPTKQGKAELAKLETLASLGEADDGDLSEALPPNSEAEA
jgi:hypothetical protein